MITLWHQNDEPNLNTLLTKCCSRCKETLPLTDFWRDKTRPSGFDNNCKPCRNEASQGKRKYLTLVAYNNWRRKQCLERVKHWTNELNKTGCGPKEK